jgi:ElaB/YqjD/DUF883 family membrane-anchored ribosome-binding protein
MITMFKNKQAAAADSGPAGTHAKTETAGVERLAASAHDGIHAAAEAVHPVIDRLASSAHRAVNSADEAANHATDALASAGSKAGEKGEELFVAGTGYMREHPLFTIGVAVAAGYLLSRLLATR